MLVSRWTLRSYLCRWTCVCVLAPATVVARMLKSILRFFRRSFRLCVFAALVCMYRRCTLSQANARARTLSHSVWCSISILWKVMVRYWSINADSLYETIERLGHHFTNTALRVNLLFPYFLRFVTPSGSVTRVREFIWFFINLSFSK